MLQHLAEVQVARPPPERYHLTFVIIKGDELPNVKDILQGEILANVGFLLSTVTLPSGLGSRWWFLPESLFPGDAKWSR